MKPTTFPFVICLLLALSMTLGGFATGRAAGIAVFEASLTEMVICSDGEGPRTVLVSRDGAPVDLPHCPTMLCDDCLKAGSDAALGTPFTAEVPAPAASANALPGNPLHHPNAVVLARSRAPPALSALL